MRFLKKFVIVIAALASGIIGGGVLGFTAGYVITGSDHANPHGGAILVGLLMFGGAFVGLILAAIIAYQRS